MDRITLKDFRCFREEQTARLAPLTLLVGENSTGKTSFLALIRALWDMAYRRRVPDFKEDPYDLGSFDDIAHHRGGRGSRAKSFEAGFDFTPHDGEETTQGPFHFEATFRKQGTAPVPSREYFSDRDRNVWIDRKRQNEGLWRLSFGTPNGGWAWRKGLPEFRFPQMAGVPLFEADILPVALYLSSFKKLHSGESNEEHLDPLDGSKQPDENDWKMLEEVGNAEMRLTLLGEPLLYASAPVRSKPHRTYDPARSSRDPEGDYIPMYLADLHFQQKKQWNDLKAKLEKFGQDSGLFDEISVRQLGRKTESGPFQIQVRKFGKPSKGPQRNLIDVGYGVSQALPVITELLRPDAPSMFLLQQPEVHLHPSAQAALGSLFCQVAGSERQLIVETHSDHLIDRVRMEVRDGESELKPEDVSILYFERDDLNVRIHSLRFDKEGNVLGAPDGYRQFFLEETARSLWKRRNI